MYDGLSNYRGEGNIKELRYRGRKYLTRNVILTFDLPPVRIGIPVPKIPNPCFGN